MMGLCKNTTFRLLSVMIILCLMAIVFIPLYYFDFEVSNYKSVSF